MEKPGSMYFTQWATYTESAMKLRISLKKESNLIAEEIISEPKQGDLASAIGRVFDAARHKVSAPLWECEIDVRQIE